MDDKCLIPVRSRELVSCPPRPDRLWVPTGLTSNEYWGLLLREYSARSVKLTTRVNDELKMHGVILSLPSSFS